MSEKRTGPPGWKMLWPRTDETWTYGKYRRIRVTADRRTRTYQAYAPRKRSYVTASQKSMDDWLDINYSVPPVPWLGGSAAMPRVIRGVLSGERMERIADELAVDWIDAHKAGWVRGFTWSGGSGESCGFRLVEEIA